MSDVSHNCFGCQKRIADHEAHIHVGLDEWSAANGLPAFGMDDLMTFAFCSACIEKTDEGWQTEAHEIVPVEAGPQ